jgi:hypothetical protein
MDKHRIDTLADEVYNTVFQLLDGEPEMNGDDAGRIAAQVTNRFRGAMAELDDDGDLKLADGPWSHYENGRYDES